MSKLLQAILSLVFGGLIYAYIPLVWNEEVNPTGFASAYFGAMGAAVYHFIFLEGDR